MAHPRKLIRESWKNRLALALPDATFRTRAQGRIFASRLAPVDADVLKEDGPAILIYARMEKYNADKDYGSQGDATFIERELMLCTEAMLVAKDTVDDDLDDMAEEIEAAFSDFLIPGFESARFRLVESDIDLITESVKRPIGAIGLVWQINYRTDWRPRPDADNAAKSMSDFLAGN